MIIQGKCGNPLGLFSFFFKGVFYPSFMEGIGFFDFERSINEEGWI
jgi:hypothetical protein